MGPRVGGLRTDPWAGRWEPGRGSGGGIPERVVSESDTPMDSSRWWSLGGVRQDQGLGLGPGLELELQQGPELELELELGLEPELELELGGGWQRDRKAEPCGGLGPDRVT